MTKAEKKLDELGFYREVNYYQKNNLDIIQDIRYVKRTDNQIFEITFSVIGDNKKDVNFRLYDKYGISVPTVEYSLGQVVLERKEELGWT